MHHVWSYDLVTPAEGTSFTVQNNIFDLSMKKKVLRQYTRPVTHPCEGEDLLGVVLTACGCLPFVPPVTATEPSTVYLSTLRR